MASPEIPQNRHFSPKKSIKRILQYISKYQKIPLWESKPLFQENPRPFIRLIVILSLLYRRNFANTPPLHLFSREQATALRQGAFMKKNLHVPAQENSTAYNYMRLALASRPRRGQECIQMKAINAAHKGQSK